MAVARKGNPWVAAIATSNLMSTFREMTPELIVDGTVEGGQPCKVHTDFLTWKQATNTAYCAGILEWIKDPPNGNWGTTTPAFTTAYPTTIKHMKAISFGRCIGQIDVDKWADGSLHGMTAYVNATGLVGGTQTNTHVAIGTLWDIQAGNDGADGDPVEIFVGRYLNFWEDGP